MSYIDNLSVPEGPAGLPDGSWLVVEMGPGRGCVTHVFGPDGDSRRTLARTGRPNGLAVAREGSIWVAESEPPSLLRMAMDGSYEAVVTAYAGEALLFPNDLCFGPDRMLYLTDSGITYEEFAPGGKVRSDYAHASVDGRAYRVDPHTFEIELLTDGIRFANGLAFGPGDEHLYVAETLTAEILRYSWSRSGLGRPEAWGNVVSDGGAQTARSATASPRGEGFRRTWPLACPAIEGSV